MKKLISLFTVLLFILSGCLWFSTDTYADETKSSDSETAASETVPETQASPVILPTDKVSTDDIILYSSAACVIDVDSGEILYYKNMDDRHYPASITKVLTGLLLIENANLDDTITFSQDCWNGLNYYNDMNIGILDGEQLTVNDALHAILMSSANEVCNGAAKFVSGSVSAFCDLMNERAKTLGCTNTHFVNPNGLHDPDHYTSAHDMALISREAIQNPTFREITGCTEYTVASTNLRPEGFPLSHKHQMLMYTKYHYDACIGGKTGYTSEAPLTETETETEAAVPDARTSLSPKVLASHLKSKLMTFAMHHMILFILCMLVAFALFTLILIWLYHVLKRSYHRHKYKRLRNERIKNIKNK